MYHESDEKDLYSSRLSSLEAQIHAFFQRVSNDDEILRQMGQDSASSAFKPERIRELLENCLNIDQESTISSLIQNNLLLKSQIKQIEDAFSQKSREKTKKPRNCSMKS